MMLRSPRLAFEAMLFVLALGLGATAAFGPLDNTFADQLYFGAWCAAMLRFFSLALRLPLHLRPALGRVVSPAIVTAAVALAVLSNTAVYRHDVALRRYRQRPLHRAARVADDCAQPSARCGPDLFLQQQG